LAELFEVDTVGAVVVVVVAAVLGVVVADVAPLVDDEPDEVELDDVVEELVELVAVEALGVVFLALTVAPPAWAASPANRPVPARAPASDHRVICLIRRRPASRSALVRGRRGEVLMPYILGPGRVRVLVTR
jgi:hypothetical protein